MNLVSAHQHNSVSCYVPLVAYQLGPRNLLDDYTEHLENRFPTSPSASYSGHNLQQPVLPSPALLRISLLERQPQTQAGDCSGELPQDDAFSLSFLSLRWVGFSGRGR